MKRTRSPPQRGRDANPIIARRLGLLLVLGVAPSRGSALAPEARPAPDGVAVRRGVCERRSTVTVHVDNTSSTDVQVSFGGYTPARPAPGFSRTTYQVARSNLRSVIRLRIVRPRRPS